MSKPIDGPAEGPISDDELRDLWVEASPIQISRETNIAPKEVYRRLKEIERQLVEQAKVISHEKDNNIIVGE